MLGPLSGLLSPLAWIRRYDPTYLLRDDFLANQAAPLPTPRTCEPGPGSLTIFDSANRLSITGQALRFSGGQALDNPRAMSPDAVLAHTCGLGYFARARTSAITNNAWRLGFGTSPNSRPAEVGWQHGASNWLCFSTPLGPSTLGITPVINTWFWFAAILRNTGAWFLIKGGSFTEWTLVWVDDAHTLSPLYVGAAQASLHAVVQDVDTIRLQDLSANGYTPWSTDSGPATDQIVGNVVTGSTFIHEADGLLRFYMPAGAIADQKEMSFRQQDASNKWAVRITVGGDISLQEYIGGVPTQQAVSVGVVAGGHPVTIVMSGTTIRGYSNHVLRWTYAAAVNYQTETDGTNGGGTVENLTAWPRTMSGDALFPLLRIEQNA